MDPEEFPVLQYTMQLYYHTLKMGIGEDPPIQIASGILIKGLSKFGFNHIFDEELFYMLFGFVNKKTSLKNHAFYVGSFGYLTGIRRYRKIEKLGFNYDNNVTLEYSRKQGDFSDDDSGFPKNDAVYLHKDLLLPLIPLAISSAESLPDHAPKELSKRFSLGFTSDFKL
jgi:hypothetical protein